MYLMDSYLSPSLRDQRLRSRRDATAADWQVKNPGNFPGPPCLEEALRRGTLMLWYDIQQREPDSVPPVLNHSET